MVVEDIITVLVGGNLGLSSDCGKRETRSISLECQSRGPLKQNLRPCLRVECRSDPLLRDLTTTHKRVYKV